MRLAWLVSALGLVGLAALIVTSGFGALHASDEELRAQAWRNHTLGVLVETERLGASLERMLRGERGYILTGQPEFLEPYDAARVDAARSTQALRQAIAADPDQKVKLDALAQAQARFAEELQTTLDLDRKGRRAEALARIRERRGETRMREVTGALEAIMAQEQKLLTQRVAEADAAARRARNRDVSLTVLSAVLLALAAGVAGGAVVRERRRRLQDGRMQAQLRASEERLRLAARAAHLGAWDIDLVTGIGRRDALTLELSGLAPDQAEFTLGEWITSVHPDDRPAFIAARDAALQPGGPDFHAEFRRLGDGGEERWLIIDGQVIRDPETGRPLRAVGVLRDNTAQRQAEQDLRRSESRLRAILETLPIGVIVRSAQGGRVIFANRAVEAILRRPAAPELDPAAGAFDGAYHADGRPMAPNDTPIMQVLAGGGAHDGELRYVRRDGSAVWLRVIAEPLHDEDGGLLGGIVAFVDVDEQRSLVEHQQLLVAELSHRVKNVLAVVQGLASATLRRSASLPEFAMAFEGRLQALGVAHSLLLRSSWRGMDLNQLVGAVMASFVEVGDRLAAEGPPVELDAKQGVGMALILHELATNAVKYGALAAPSGRIEVVWGRDSDDRVELTWREIGVRMPDPPPADGFGTTLIRRSAQNDLRGTAERTLGAEGFFWRIRFPLSAKAGL